ncbi:hypothetical protein Z517_07775 [Fonsecaea pedrosoi CBS 271.37]|uniref:RING-type domain-containing protein n=1 Tax=Fonsecaea pedrosoi CBS 271.37 TaxID=1442368 RepID=A0A0D2EUL5_9EURO|nr:uncharacterized protein Z517_07775 [Fonsecaea pedrosoi CBS 271.37]KIW77942.1 hypothetical protein Z517_07775 [Fonsecaea pedrosoi CBS 271.37]
MSRTVDFDGDQEMAEPAAVAARANRSDFDWRARRLANLSGEERHTVGVDIATTGGRTYLEETRWKRRAPLPNPLLDLPPIAPGNPYFFHEQMAVPIDRLGQPERQTLPPLSSLGFNWNRWQAEQFVDQRRRANALPPPQQHIIPEQLEDAYAADDPALDAYAPQRSTLPSECVVCFEEHQAGELVILHYCQCAYCLPCLNQAFRIACRNRGSFPPTCHGIPLRISSLGSVLDHDVVARYKQIEAEFGAHRPFYCAAQRCSAFVPEKDRSAEQQVAVCPQCHKLTCTSCERLQGDHPSWATEVEERVCPAPEEGVTKLYELRDEHQWRQCPTCGIMVEKTDGCDHMNCVCGIEFCYVCGTLFDESSRCGCDDEEYYTDDEEEEDTAIDEPLPSLRWPFPAIPPTRVPPIPLEWVLMSVRGRPYI